MHVHWFSPLLPDATDIGHFTGRVLRELAKLCYVTVWTETPNASAEMLPGIEIRRFNPGEPDYAALNKDGAIVYNIGNNGPFHAGIYQMSQKVPGVVLLHEADLQGLFAFLWLHCDHDPARYIAYARETYGALGEIFARARLRGIPLDDRAHQYPIVAPALSNALGVICHTPQVAQLAGDRKLPVLQLHLPFAASDISRATNREGPIRLVQFGYLNPYRKLDEIFSALAQNPSQHLFRFDIFGHLWDEAYVSGRIKALGLQGTVHLRGFVDEAVLDEAVATSDMVFNLRYPTIGEASGTQMRIWNNAAPSAVTDDGWFRNLPDDTVLKVLPGDEVAAVGSILDRLATERLYYESLGARGRATLIKFHSPVEYASAVLEFLKQFDAFERRHSQSSTLVYVQQRRNSLCGAK
jgi:glycosyltransferase involved in cell wall biosynthesis